MATYPIYSRKYWGARAARGSTPNPLGPGSTLFIHYSAGKAFGKYDTKEEQKAHMRQLQAYHMDMNGWDDGGYSFVVFQPSGPLRRARIYMLRGYQNVPAAQRGHNTGNGAVCVICGPGERIRRSTIRRLRYLYRLFPGNTVRGHREVNATACPGDYLYRNLDKIRSAK